MKNNSNKIRNTSVWIFIIIVAAISVVVFLYLPFQGSLFSETKLKKVYYVDNISGAHQKIINKFNAKYRNQIEVVPVNLPFHHFTTNDRKAILTRSLRNRSDGIDIFAVDLIWVPRFAKWAYSIEDEFDKKTIESVNEMALEPCYQNDSLVAFPLFLDMGVLYYRRDLIHRLPGGAEIEKKIQNSLTWDEFSSLCRRLQTFSNPCYVFTGGNFEGLMCCYNEMLSDEETNKIFYNKPINIDTPSSRRAIQQLVDFIYKDNFSPYAVTGFDEFNSYLYFNNNDAVFLRGWVGFHKQYKYFLDDTTKIAKMDIAPLPHFKENSTSGTFGGWSLMISKYSNRKDDAIKFINFMFEKENQQLLYDEAGVLPINKEVYSDSNYLNQNKELGKIQKLMKWGKHRPVLENYTKISEIMSKSLHRSLRKEISVDVALKSASELINNERTIVK